MSRFHYAPAFPFLVVLALGWAPWATAQGQAPAPAVAPGPAAALVSHVPDDFGLCLTMQDLRGGAARWSTDPWWKKVRTSPLGQALLQSKEFKDLDRVQAQLKKHLEVDWLELRDEIFGDAVVFAYKPGTAGGSEGEVGLFLLQARDADLLARLFAKINEAQKRSGEVKELEKLPLGRGAYWRRVQKKDVQFCFLEAGLFCFSNDEKLVKDILTRILDGTAGPSRWWADVRRAGADNAMFSVAVGPRAFDAEIQERSGKSTGTEAMVLRQFRSAWSALDRVVMALRPAETVELDFTLLYRDSDLPSGWRGLLQGPAGSPGIWKKMPSNAILALGGTFDGPALMDFARELFGGTDKSILAGLERMVNGALGLDLSRDVLPNIGPDWGACLLPAAAPGQPPQVLAALAVRGGKGEAGVDQSLFRGIEFLARFAVLEHNRTSENPIRLRSLKENGMEAKYFESKGFPTGFQPACALKEGYLIFSTSLAAVVSFGKDDGIPAQGKGSTLLWFSFHRLALEFRNNRTWHLENLASRNGYSTDESVKTLDGILAILDLFHRMELVRTASPGRWTWNLRIHLARD